MNELSDGELPQSLHNLAIYKNGFTIILTEVTEIDTIQITKRTTTSIFKDKGDYFHQVYLVLNNSLNETSPLKKITKKDYDSLTKEMLKQITDKV